MLFVLDVGKNILSGIITNYLNYVEKEKIRKNSSDIYLLRHERLTPKWYVGMLTAEHCVCRS